MSDIADKIYAATGLTLNAEAAAAIGQMIQAENEKLRAALQWLLNALEDYPVSTRPLAAYNNARAALGEKE